MPKVETSQSLTGGKRNNHQLIITMCSKNVSNLTGNDAPRRKRNVDAEPPGRRRFVKKLVRVEPVRKNIGENFRSVDVSQDVQASQKTVAKFRPRKRVVIKKRKHKMLTPLPIRPSRRVVVVTKKRLITRSSETPTTENVTPVLPNSVAESTTSTGIPTETETFAVDDRYDDGVTSEALDLKQDENYVSSESGEDVTVHADTEPATVEDYENSTQRATAKESLERDNILDEEEPVTEVYQNVPDYEPSFPELSLDAPIKILKTTVLSSVELRTKTVVQSRLRTYTFLITRVNGDEQMVTSTTEVRPHTKTIVVTEPLTRYTTLTLLNLDPSDTRPFVPMTDFPADPSSQRNSDIIGESRSFCKFFKNFCTNLTITVVVRFDLTPRIL